MRIGARARAVGVSTDLLIDLRRLDIPLEDAARIAGCSPTRPAVG